MSRLHILQRTGPNLYDAVIHAPVPSGTNSAGVEWSQAIIDAGLNRTSLKMGKGGQITDEEAALIAAGKVIETQMHWGVDTGLDDGFVEEHIAKNGADGIAAGALGEEKVETKIRNLKGEEVFDDAGVAVVVETTRRVYRRGVDSQLDAVVDDGRAKAVDVQLNRLIADHLAEVMDRLDQPMMTVE